MNKETIIKGCENWVNNHKDEDLLLTYSSVVELLTVLKEQAAVEPKKADNPEESEYCCGICGYPLWLDELYCAHCGRRIEWNVL